MDSGIQFETQNAQNFKRGIIEGRWDQVTDIIPEFNIEPNNQSKVHYCLKEQKYLELVEKGDFSQALECLRNEMTPNHTQDHDKLHKLASHLLCGSPDELYQAAN